jgi:predicted nucleotidyltransferase
MSVTWGTRDGRAEWDGRLLVEWVPDLVQEVVALLEPEAVWLFGSVARGDDDGDSDIDLLVVLSQFDAAETVALKQRVHRSVSVPVPFDVAFTDPERFAQRSGVAGTLERATLLEGRLVHERG